MKPIGSIPPALGVVLSLGVAVATRAGPADQPPPGDEGCDAFAWPVSNERAWFDQKALRRSASGVRLSRIDRAVEVTLEPTKAVRFFLPPAKAPSPDSYSGNVTFFGVPHPGVYQVTISREAAIDVFENGMRIPKVAVSEATDCRSVRKSVRYRLGPGDLVLVQISGAAQPSIKIAFEESPNRL
jgi:hypothetical protein